MEPGLICYRLDFDELEQLLTQGQLEQSLALPKGELHYRVFCLPKEEKAVFQTEQMNSSQMIFSLSLARDTIEAHKAALPSLKGISHFFTCQNSDDLEVTLEVNLKKKVKRGLA